MRENSRNQASGLPKSKLRLATVCAPPRPRAHFGFFIRPFSSEAEVELKDGFYAGLVQGLDNLQSEETAIQNNTATTANQALQAASY